MILVGKLLEQLAKKAGWHPEGKRIRILIDEGFDQSLLGKVIPGVIQKYIAKIKTEGPASGKKLETYNECVIIQLDAPLRYREVEFSRLAAVPRHGGFGVYRLPLTSFINVYIIPLVGSSEPQTLPYNDIIAMWELKLVRGKNGRCHG